jgi:hypothetical protein
METLVFHQIVGGGELIFIENTLMRKSSMETCILASAFAGYDYDKAISISNKAAANDAPH